MFLVRTYVAASPIHGLGVFAAEPIPRGTPIWRFQPGFDQVIPFALAEQLPASAREFLATYTYLSPLFPGGYVLNGDHARFLNHSDTPNTDNSGEIALALRDIAEGEEITCDYGECCEHYEL